MGIIRVFPVNDNTVQRKCYKAEPQLGWSPRERYKGIFTLQQQPAPGLNVIYKSFAIAFWALGSKVIKKKKKSINTQTATLVVQPIQNGAIQIKDKGQCWSYGLDIN